MLRITKARLHNKVCHRTLETSGQLVPFFYVAKTGQVQRRQWTLLNPHWCSLCSEPIPATVMYAGHVSRGDHCNRDAHYNAIVEYCYRTWNCEHILRHLFVKTKKRRKDGKRRSACDLAPVSMQYFLAKIHADELKRRQDIYHLTLYLHQCGLLCLDRQKMFSMMAKMGGGSLQSALVAAEYFRKAIFRLLPDCDVGGLTSIDSWINASYNYETVYDICGFGLLDNAVNGADGGERKADQTTNHRLSFVGGIKPNIPADGGAAAEAKEEETSLGFKSSFVRNIMGQLRFALSEDKPHPLGLEVSAPVRLICVYLVKAIVMELVAVRTSEYMIRCDPIWRTLGMERRNIAELMAAHEETLQYGVEYAAPSTYYAPGVGMYRRIALHGKDLYDV